jgi:hypothetical protein
MAYGQLSRYHSSKKSQEAVRYCKVKVSNVYYDRLKEKAHEEATTPAHVAEQLVKQFLGCI